MKSISHNKAVKVKCAQFYKMRLNDNTANILLKV